MAGPGWLVTRGAIAPGAQVCRVAVAAALIVERAAVPEETTAAFPVLKRALSDATAAKLAVRESGWAQRSSGFPSYTNHPAAQ